MALRLPINRAHAMEIAAVLAFALVVAISMHSIIPALVGN